MAVSFVVALALGMQILSLLVSVAVILQFRKIRNRRMRLFTEISRADGRHLLREGRSIIFVYGFSAAALAVGWVLLLSSRS